MSNSSSIDEATELLLRLAFTRYVFGLDVDAATLIAGAELLGGPPELINFFKGLLLASNDDHERALPLLEASTQLQLPPGMEKTRRAAIIRCLLATGRKEEAQKRMNAWADQQETIVP